MASTIQSLLLCTIGICAMLASSAQAQRSPLRRFGYPNDNFVDHECAPVGRCPRPCRLGKEITGCALCVCPPACKPCFSNCYFPSRPDECPQCAYDFYCELGHDSIYPEISFAPGLGLGR